MFALPVDDGADADAELVDSPNIRPNEGIADAAR